MNLNGHIKLCPQRERRQILKLFLVFQATGLISGIAIAGSARLDPLLSMSWGLGLGSVNFGVSLCLSSKQ